MKERESMYLEGLSGKDIKTINALPAPWQRSFLKNFYEKISSKNLSKQKLCENIHYNKSPLVPSDYELNASTLTNYTNKERPRELSVNCLLSLAHEFDVSVEYLLGIESCEKHSVTDIFEVTGLEEKSIDKLHSSPQLQTFINYFLQDSRLSDIMSQIENLFYTQYVTSDLLEAFSDDLKNIILSSYKKYIVQKLPISRTEDDFITFFKEEPQMMETQITIDYIKNNVSADILLMIKNEIEKNLLSVSDAFFKVTISYVYDVLPFAIAPNYYYSQLSNYFSELIIDYISQNRANLKKELVDNLSEK